MILLIRGFPVAQGRPRFARIGEGVRAYDPAKSRTWKQDVAVQAIAQKPRMMEGPLDMELIFYLPRPKSLPKKVRHHVKKPDIDNLNKSVLDGLKGIAYKDDSQIVCKKTDKVYAEPGCPVGVWININPAGEPVLINWLDAPAAPEG